MRKPRRSGNTWIYTFRNEKEAHFFHLFIHYHKNAPILGAHHSANNTVILIFEVTSPIASQAFRVVLKTLCTTINHAFPDFLTRSDSRKEHTS